MREGFKEDIETVEDFVTYFEKTWIGANNNITGVRKTPMYKHSYWNKFLAVTEEDVLTSNAAEGYYHALAMSLPKNASIWGLTEQ